jgi:hypothetical protein
VGHNFPTCCLRDLVTVHNMPNVRSIKEILCERHGVCTVDGGAEPANEQHHVLYDGVEIQSAVQAFNAGTGYQSISPK